MPRNPKPDAQVIDVNVNEAALEGAANASNELAALYEKDSANVRALAAELNYEGPLDADSLHKEVVGTGAALARATLFHGTALLLLREATLHGDWEHRLGMLPYSRRTAYSYMTIAAKFRDKKTREALVNLSTMKLLELTALDDEEIGAFVQGESVRGLTLDETEKMSHKELRAALREERAERQAGEKVREDLSKKLTKLQTQAKRIQTQDPDTVLIDLTKEASALAMDAVGLVRGNVRQALVKLQEHAAEHGGDVMVTMAGMVGQLQLALLQLREEFDLPDLSHADQQKLAAEVSQWAGN